MARTRDAMRQLNMRGEIDGPRRSRSSISISCEPANGSAQCASTSTRDGYVREVENMTPPRVRPSHVQRRSFNNPRASETGSDRIWVFAWSIDEGLI